MIKLPKLLITTATMLLSACATTNVFKHSTTEGDVTGIPYNLPKTVIEVALVLSDSGDGNEQNLQLSATAKRVPDQSAIYYLDPETESWLMNSNHHFIFENGMINSLDTVDKGETGAVIENATSSLINLAKSAVSLTQSTKEQPFVKFQSYPTEVELQAMALMLMSGSAKFTFDPELELSKRMMVPGTNGLLYLKVGSKRGDYEQDENFSAKAEKIRNSIDWLKMINMASNIDNQCEKVQINGLEQGNKLISPVLKVSSDGSKTVSVIKIKGSGTTSGLFTRTLRDFNLTTRLYTDLHMLRRVRAERMYEQFRDVLDDLNFLLNTKANLKSEEAFACPNADKKKFEDNIIKTASLENQIEKLSVLALYTNGKIPKEQITARLDGLRNNIAQLKAKQQKLKVKKQKCDSAAKAVREQNPVIQKQCITVTGMVDRLNRLKEWNPKGDFLVASSEETLLVTSKDAIEIPVTRASIGETINSLKFDNGILVDYHQSKPSEGKVLTESLVRATSALYDGIVDIAQIPAKALGFQLKEVQAKQTLTDAQIILKNKQDRLKGKRADIQEILLNAQLEAVLADPAANMGLLD